MGKKARRRQRATMNEMNELANEQFDYFTGQQQIAQDRVEKESRPMR